MALRYAFANQGTARPSDCAQHAALGAYEAAELRAVAAEKSALLAAAEERLARLEALHRVAQVLTATSSEILSWLTKSTP